MRNIGLRLDRQLMWWITDGELPLVKWLHDIGSLEKIYILVDPQGGGVTRKEDDVPVLYPSLDVNVVKAGYRRPSEIEALFSEQLEKFRVAHDSAWKPPIVLFRVLQWRRPKKSGCYVCEETVARVPSHF